MRALLGLVIAAAAPVAAQAPQADTAAVRRRVRARVPNAIVLAAPGERHALR